MTNEVKELVKEYIIKNPNLNYSELATCIKEDNASILTHRSLRLYIQQVKSKMEANQTTIDFDGAATTDPTFEDLTPSFPEDQLLDLDPAANVVVIKKNTPKVLVFDIETSPIQAWTWRIGRNLSIGHSQVTQQSFILGWCAKWLGDSNEAKTQDQARIIKSLYSLVNEADITITHNGDNFDRKKLNTAVTDLGLLPLTPSRSIDTYKVCKAKFNMESLKLDYLGERWFDEKKLSTSFELWTQCMNGDQIALDYMKEYCKMDVRILEKVYYKVMPYIKNPPSLAVLHDDEISICPTCGGTEFNPIDKLYITSQNAFEMVRCADCGAVSRTRKSVITKEKRKNTLVPCAY
jgi:DNA polymerase elongation subunit (family B)/Zn ribbon nucleic-acid-binding protein